MKKNSNLSTDVCFWRSSSTKFTISKNHSI